MYNNAIVTHKYSSCVPSQRRYAFGVSLAAAVVIAGAGLLTFDPSSSDAAVLTVGTSNPPPYGSNFCADVVGGGPSDGTYVMVNACTASLINSSN
jgi:hypothetical protein